MKFEMNALKNLNALKKQQTILCYKFYIYNLKKKICMIIIILFYYLFNNLSTIFYLYKNQNHVLILVMLASCKF